MIDGTLPGYWGNSAVSFTVTNGTRAKILVDVSPAQVVAAVSGETALPGESAVRQRVLMGGCRVVDGMISSTDSVAKSLNIWTGLQTTLYANMGVCTTTATTNSTITRTVGSFITDGYAIGDQIMVFGSISASAANDGVPARVTGVAAGTLTLDGTGGISVAGTEGAGYRIFRVGQATRKAIALTAGTADAVQPVPLMGGSQDPRVDTTGIMLGATGVVIVGLAAALSALPAQVCVTAHWGLY